MKPKVYIDGQEGTTGLQIYERLGSRGDIELITIPGSLRKDAEARIERLNAADLVFLCLPDDAAREAVGMIYNPHTRVIDASTAHRTAPGWVYGFPELTRERRAELAEAKRVANPGCHATGFVAITAPLVAAGILPRDTVVPAYSLTGHSGGGKKMIAQYQDEGRDGSLSSPRIYGLTFSHKHVPEMLAVSGLTEKPLFSPIVNDYYCGIAVSVLLHHRQLVNAPTSEDLRDVLGAHYQGEQFIQVAPFGGADALVHPGYIESNAHIGTNTLELIICGDGERTLLTARFDNLGKGASGAAVQNMNLMLGLPETAGLSD